MIKKYFIVYTNNVYPFILISLKDHEDVLVKMLNQLLSTVLRVKEDQLDLLGNKVLLVCQVEMVQADDLESQENKVSLVLKVLLAFLVTVVNLDRKDL